MSKLILLTGFLGAGKTTFLNHVLHEYADEKVGLIVNEFSGTGVDGALIRKDIPGAEMVELNNGSIFCACIKDNFVDSLIALSAKGLSYVFVEASGLADPSSITSIVEQIHKLSGVVYDYCGSICLVDSVYFLKYLDLLVALRRQVEYSRAVIINKIDLADEEQIWELEAAIREINPDTALYHATYGQISLKEILSENRPEEAVAKDSSNTEITRPVNVTLTTAEAVPLEKLQHFLNEIAPYTYRVKGLCLTEAGVVNVSMVGDICQTEAWDASVARTQLVIISSVGIRVISETLKAAKSCFREPVELK